MQGPVGTDSSRLNEEDRVSLFEWACNDQWGKIVEECEKKPAVETTKITRSGETVLHLALMSSKTATRATQLLDIIINRHRLAESGSKPPAVLGMLNERGNTPLHLAAEIGEKDLCQRMAAQDPNCRGLLDSMNIAGETPIFVAALHGKTEVFLSLYDVYYKKRPTDTSPPSNRHTLFRRTDDGNTVLHSAISAEHFGLALEIVNLEPKLLVQKNMHGLTPLHVLASKPDAFRSHSQFGFIDHIIYKCLTVDLLSGDDHGGRGTSYGGGDPKYPENYAVCVRYGDCFWKLLNIILGTNKRLDKEVNKNDEEAPLNKSNLPQGINRLDKIVKNDKENPSNNQNLSQGTSRSDKVVTNDKEDPSNNQNLSQDINRSDKEVKINVDDQSNRGNLQEESLEKENPFPPNYVTTVLIFNMAMKLVLVILGFGLSKIKKIEKKKLRHKWSNEVMKELIEHDPYYKNCNNGDGQEPRDEEQSEALKALRLGHEFPSSPDKQNETETKASAEKKMKVFEIANQLLDTHQLTITGLDSDLKSSYHLKLEKEEDEQLKKNETPLLTAARMGITEMVDRILVKFPMAIHDLDSDGKNAMLLAVENRKVEVYQLLTKYLRKYLLENRIFRDRDGNSVVHLAAKYGGQSPWRVPGAALQMQWEYKWYKFVKESVPSSYFDRRNAKGQTARDVFTETHKSLVQEGSEWITKTSESCSVVAALIAGVAFTTSATVPGGNKDEGMPNFIDKPAFHVFSISSLIALCFSVSSLVCFLSVLTSRRQERDFAQSLPLRLLLGLSALFLSIASMLTSFCAGHVFVLNGGLEYIAYPIYAATSLPVTFFALVVLPLYVDLIFSTFKKVPELTLEDASR